MDFFKKNLTFDKLNKKVDNKTEQSKIHRLIFFTRFYKSISRVNFDKNVQNLFQREIVILLNFSINFDIVDNFNRCRNQIRNAHVIKNFTINRNIT